MVETTEVFTTSVRYEVVRVVLRLLIVRFDVVTQGTARSASTREDRAAKDVCIVEVAVLVNDIS